MGEDATPTAGDRIRGRVLAALRGEAWAILPEKLELLDQIVVDRLLHGRLIEERSEILVVEPQAVEPTGPLWSVQDVGGGRQIATLPIHGVLSKRMGYFERMSGGMSTDAIATAARDLERDDAIAGVVLDVDSPGGQVAGTEAAAAAVRRLADAKPVYSVANDAMYSGAYWIGSAARRVFLREASGAGSVGVITMHFDRSKQMANYGIKPTIIAAGRHKAVGNEYTPLDEDALGVIKERIHSLYETFVANVAANRRLSIEHVRERIADGRVFTGRQAIDVGAADEIGGLEQAIAKLTGDLSSASSRGVVLVHGQNPNAAAEPAAAAAAAATSTANPPAAAAPPAPAPAAAEPPKPAAVEPAAADAASIRQAAVAAEKARQGEIRGLCTAAGVEPAVADQFIDADCSVETTRERLFAIMKERNKAAAIGGQPTATPGAPQTDAEKARAAFDKDKDIHARLGVTFEAFQKSFANGMPC